MTLDRISPASAAKRAGAGVRVVRSADTGCISVSVASSPGEAPIGAHIASISTRAESDTEQLISALLGRCWPGGPADRREPGALEWVRRWGPRRGGPTWLACSCKEGRCRVCN